MKKRRMVNNMEQTRSYHRQEQLRSRSQEQLGRRCYHWKERLRRKSYHRPERLRRCYHFQQRLRRRRSGHRKRKRYYQQEQEQWRRGYHAGAMEEEGLPRADEAGKEELPRAGAVEEEEELLELVSSR